MIAVALVLLVGCKVVGGTGAGEPPELGQRYTCTVDRSCYPDRSVVPSSPCATDRGDAEFAALDGASCAGCVCIVTCARQSPPRICSVPPQLHADAAPFP